MKFCKPFHFRIYEFPLKLFLLTVLCFFSLNCDKNEAKQNFSQENRISVSETAVNINTASAEELEKLPNIGEKTAREIINYREKFGAFRKPEHLMLVRGISDERFRKIRSLIKTE